MKRFISMLKILNSFLFIIICSKLMNKPLISVLITTIIYLTLSDILHTIIHELGHLVGGIFSGYKFFSFQFANFKLRKYQNTGTYSLHFESELCGQCVMIPKSTACKKYILYNIAGIFFNFALFLIVGIFTIISYNNLPTYILVFMYAFLIIGINKLLSNAIPHTNNSKLNDMSIILMLHGSKQTLADYIHYLCFYEKMVCKLPLPKQYNRQFEVTDHYNPVFYNEITKLLDSD